MINYRLHTAPLNVRRYEYTVVMLSNKVTIINAGHGIECKSMMVFIVGEMVFSISLFLRVLTTWEKMLLQLQAELIPILFFRFFISKLLSFPDISPVLLC